MRFSKMHGLGNDFVMLEDITAPLPAPLTAAAIAALANRRLGIGFDQLLLLSPAQDTGSDYFYRIFNADGGEVGQCGNGVRCAHAFLRARGISDKPTLRFHTITTNITTRVVSPGRIRAIMPPEKMLPSKSIDGHNFYRLNIGNPHFVCLSDSDDNAADNNTTPPAHLSTLGARINAEEPDGANVGIGIIKNGDIHLSVYERGVGITAACGSGALAAAVVAIRNNKTANPARVNMKGGALLCGINEDNTIWLEGEVSHVYDGELTPPASQTPQPAQ